MFTISTEDKTKLACPVNVSDEYKICGTDNRTYDSLCRMILETDGVEVLFKGPCDRKDCGNTVSIATCYTEIPHCVYCIHLVNNTQFIN